MIKRTPKNKGARDHKQDEKMKRSRRYRYSGIIYVFFIQSQIEFEGRFGVPKLVLDNIRISPLLCCKFLEYSSVNVIHLRLTHVTIAVLLH